MTIYQLQVENLEAFIDTVDLEGGEMFRIGIGDHGTGEMKCLYLHDGDIRQLRIALNDLII